MDFPRQAGCKRQTEPRHGVCCARDFAWPSAGLCHWPLVKQESDNNMFVSKQILVLAILAVTMAYASKCKPECRWQCDDPVCPAQCHPVCERPECEVECEETPCAKCTVHCNRPVCDVRCPKDMCEDDDCPKCETVCHPANCYTSCTAPEPTCGPVCKETQCSWSCKKPTLCPKPKCELVCDKTECEYEEPEEESEDCCECTVEVHASAAVELANSVSKVDAHHELPSMLEVMNGFRHAKESNAKKCCPCGDKN